MDLRRLLQLLLAPIDRFRVRYEKKNIKTIDLLTYVDTPIAT